MTTRYIVIDFEFNQPFDFSKGKSLPGEWGCPEEIIQIGAVKLNEKLEQIETFDCYVRPTLYRRLHPFVRKVTGIRQGALDRARPFPEAFDRLAKFMGTRKGLIFCTWGGDDVKALFRNMLKRQIDANRAPKRFINVQTLAAEKMGINGQVNLAKAVDALELEADLEYHDALHDAIYTANILRAVAPEGGITEEMIQTFDSAALKRTVEHGIAKVDMRGLIAYAKARFHHELTDTEKLAVARIYQAGREGKFDTKAAHRADAAAAEDAAEQAEAPEGPPEQMLEGDAS